MSHITKQSTTTFAADQDGMPIHYGWTSQIPLAKSKPLSHAPATKRTRSVSSKQTPTKAKPDTHIPRPSNKFLLFRTEYVANRPNGEITPGGKSLSKLAAEAWENLSLTKKSFWAKKALEIREEHARKYPNWTYKPRRKTGQPKKKVSTNQRRLEQSIITFHSKPEASASLPPVEFPSHLMHRKQSLRLSNWDDSVLAPIPTAPSSWYGNQELPEVLRRRSSSVPLPEWTQQAPNPHPFQVNLQPLHQHRLSYSGIRAGFVPINPPPVEWMHQAHPQETIDSSLQSIPETQIDPTDMFGGYQITYIPRGHEDTLSLQPRPVSTLQESKLLRRYEQMEDLSSSSQSESHYQPYYSSESVDSWGAVAHQSPGSTTTESPTRGPASGHTFHVSACLPMAETKLEKVQSNTSFLRDATEPEHLIERMQSIDFGSSRLAALQASSVGTYGSNNLKPLTPLNVEFFLNNSDPFSPFSPQYVQYRGELQLAGLNEIVEGDIIGASQIKEPSIGSPAYPYAAYVDQFHMNNEILEYPLSAGTSASGSRGDSPLTDDQRLDPTQLEL